MCQTWERAPIGIRFVNCLQLLYVYGFLTEAEAARCSKRIRQAERRGEFEEPKAAKKAGA